MDASVENSLLEVKPSKNINLLSLDKNIAHLISGYLTDKGLINLCLISKGLHSIFRFSLERQLMSYFLKFVVEGRLDKVEEILDRNRKLVFLQGDITDLSGREFKRITAFQYAAWALDKEMWELILRYLPETDAYNQLMVFEHERLDITQIHGRQFNFTPLLDAYQKYIDHYELWTLAQYEACWCKEVGGAQHQTPAWFVYVFCEEGEDKAWLTENFKKNFTRDPKHLTWWFNHEENGGKLGVKFGIGGRLLWRGVWGAVRFIYGWWAEIDRQHLNSCQAERTRCRDSLNGYLRQAAEMKTSVPKLNNF